MSEDKTINGGKVEIKVPLEEWAKTMIRQTVAEAQKACPIIAQVNENTEALVKNRVRWAALIAYGLGSGIASGTTVFAIMKAFGG